MSKIRVYELAKELEISSKELITLLMEEFGVEVKNHMSVIEEEDAELIKEYLESNNDKETATSKVAEEKKSLVDEYEDILSDEVNKGNKKKKKTKKQIAEEKAKAEQEFAENTILEIGETITVKELADMLQKSYAEVIKTLMLSGVMAAMNQEINYDIAAKVCDSFGILCEKKEVSSELEALDVVEEDEVN